MAKPKDKLNPILEPLRASANFEAVLVTDGAAKLVGAAQTADVARETLDALHALAYRVVGRGDDYQSLIAAKETIFFDWEGRQVVCRPFEANDQARLLVILAPRGKAYKKAATKLVKAIQAAPLPKPSRKKATPT